nr:MAG TPA_asm: hypothetical protein [Caudoviricetes sp.]
MRLVAPALAVLRPLPCDDLKRVHRHREHVLPLAPPELRSLAARRARFARQRVPEQRPPRAVVVGRLDREVDSVVLAEVGDHVGAVVEPVAREGRQFFAATASPIAAVKACQSSAEHPSSSGRAPPSSGMRPMYSTTRPQQMRFIASFAARGSLSPRLSAVCTLSDANAVLSMSNSWPRNSTFATSCFFFSILSSMRKKAGRAAPPKAVAPLRLCGRRGLGRLEVVVAGVAVLVGQVLHRQRPLAKLGAGDVEVVELRGLAGGDDLAPAAVVLQHELQDVREDVVRVRVVLDRDDAVRVGHVLLAVLALERLGLDLGERELRGLDSIGVGRVHDVAVHVGDVVGVLVHGLDVAVLADEAEALECRVEGRLDVGRERRPLGRGEDVAALHALRGADVRLVVAIGLCHAVSFLLFADPYLDLHDVPRAARVRVVLAVEIGHFRMEEVGLLVEVRHSRGHRFGERAGLLALLLLRPAVDGEPARLEHRASAADLLDADERVGHFLRHL